MPSWLLLNSLMAATSSSVAAGTLLGVNVADNDAAAGRTFHFANLVKQALPFGVPTSPCVFGMNISVCASGWPSSDFGVCMYREGISPRQSWPPANISGVYSVTARGNGTVWIPSGGSAVLNQTYDSKTNKLTAYVPLNCPRLE